MARRSLLYVLDHILLDYRDRAPKRLWLSGPNTVPKDEGPHLPKIMIDVVAYY